MKSVSLSQLINTIKAEFDNKFGSPIWIVAEISELNVNYSGHCYMELIEKEEETDKLLAKSRATIWARSFRIIQPYFETTTRETLKAGLKVLLKVTVEFHEFYGFSLNVIDIDPSFTVGDLALKRNLIIEKLTSEGVFDMNKSIAIPIVPQNIAVITSETAAGYGDFNNQLLNNSNTYHFSTTLFPAVMQGDKAPESIINAFNQIFESIDDFDAVVLIRGGGSKVDLSCFDNYDLAYMITQFPLPVITGIGHERDESISDMVANTSLKTPTAVAEFLVDFFDEYSNRLNEAYYSINYFAENYFTEKHLELKDMSSTLLYKVQNSFKSHLLNLDMRHNQLNQSVDHFFKSKKQKLQNKGNELSIVAKSIVMQAKYMCELRQKRISKWTQNLIHTQGTKITNLSSKLSLLNPERVLERGFAIVTNKQGVVKNAKNLAPGDQVHITLSKGSTEAEVKKVNK